MQRGRVGRAGYEAARKEITQTRGRGTCIPLTNQLGVAGTETGKTNKSNKEKRTGEEKSRRAEANRIMTRPQGPNRGGGYCNLAAQGSHSAHTALNQCFLIWVVVSYVQ